MADLKKKSATNAAAEPAAKPAGPKQAENTPAQPSGIQQMPSRVDVQKQRRGGLIASFLLVFVLPALLGTLYYAAVATDRYGAGASFVVRGLDSGGSGGSADIFSSFTGLTSTGSTTSDSYIIRRYLESPDLVRALDTELNLQAHYSTIGLDPLSRFDTDQPFENFVEYWQRRITTTYDSTTGIVSFEVQAFDAKMTLVLANAVLDAADRLVNALSEKARRDSVQFATHEVERAEERQRDAQLALREFRSTRGSVDPTINAKLDAELIASLETQLADVRARIEVLSASVNSDAPMLLRLKRQAAAFETQTAMRRAAIGRQDPELEGASTADALAEFETLQIEQIFAQQRFASALSSLENARMDAGRQQRYLAIFARPLLPEEAIYPYRLRNALLMATAAFVFWAIGTLITFTVRDHLS